LLLDADSVIFNYVVEVSNAKHAELLLFILNKLYL
jgi:hypothetical protein